MGLADSVGGNSQTQENAHGGGELYESEAAAQVAGFSARFGDEACGDDGWTNAERQWFARGDYWGGGDDSQESQN